MSELDYKVVGTFRKKVRHSCQLCNIDLENDLQEAGNSDVCPGCQHSFTVPGIKELTVLREAAERKRAEEEERKRQNDLRTTTLLDQKKEQERLERKAEEDRRRINEQRQVESPKTPPQYVSVQSVPQYQGLAAVSRVFQILGILAFIAAAFGIFALIR